MKLIKILAGVAISGAMISNAMAAADGILTTNTFSFSGTYSYDALTANGAINSTTNYSINASTVNHGGNLLGKKSTSVTTYSTNYSEITVLSSASFALKDFIAAINTDLTNNTDLSNVLASASLTSLPAATKLQLLTGANYEGDYFHMALELVIPVGGTNITYDLGNASMFSYSLQGDYVYSRNLNEMLSGTNARFTGALTGIVPLEITHNSTPNCMPHAQLDLYAIGTGTLNWSETNPLTGTASTTFTLSPLAGNIYVRDAHFHKVTGVFVGSGSGSGTGRLRSDG